MKAMPPGSRPVNWDTLEVEIHAKQAAFIEWLVNPEREGSQASFAKLIGVHPETLTKWKKDGPFIREWEKRAAELNVSPDRIQRVLNAMFNAATKPSDKHPYGDPTAMTRYLEYVGKFTPRKAIVIEDKGAADLNDEELAEELQRQARNLRAV